MPWLVSRSTVRKHANALVVLGLGVIPLVLSCRPVGAAERIYVSYGLLERSIAIKSLETYAKTGKIEDDLAAYTQFADPQQLPQLRSILLARAQLTPVAVSQFLYTPQGEILLRRLGQVIQADAQASGFFAIRAALILAAADSKGLTPLNVMQKFPSYGIRIDLRRSLDIANDLERLVNQTNLASAAIAQQARLEAVTNPLPDQQRLPDLRAPGSFTWTKETITLTDRKRPVYTLPFVGTTAGGVRPALPGTVRDRTFPVDIYLPQSPAGTVRPAPVIVISHGLGSDRTSFAYLAQHLASYGFAVAVPEHPGSNSRQLQALINGTANEAAEPDEFVNRPTDIKYLLDELEQRSQADPLLQGRLNLQQVGIVGQSFGGYTALSVAGAEINFPSLQQGCDDTKLVNTLNLSLLLQCRAARLPSLDFKLRDPRIKAAIAINPIDSIVLGPANLSQIQIPVMMVSGNADTAAPALPEQIQPFTWLTTPEKYLVLIDNGTHFSTLAESPPGADPVPIPSDVIGPNPAIARRYMSALCLAFFGVEVANQPEYRPYLSAAYAQAISQDPLALSLVRSWTSEQLTQAINGSPVLTTPPVVPPMPTFPGSSSPSPPLIPAP